jgi:hydroxymethylpyrimidine/phosphomethylpyrimidine kinase
MTRPAEVTCALTIAGSDSGGGAGIQADLRTFAALEVFGCSVITALTAQSTTEVRRVDPVDPEMVRAQLETVLDDLPVRHAKTGMLHRAEVVDAIAPVLTARRLTLVVDPVMVAESGARLLEPAAERAIVERLFPLAALVTPNLPEVEVLVGARPEAVDDMIDAGRLLLARGAAAALVKGGHRVGAPTDVLVAKGAEPLVLDAPRVETRATHGTGCTYAAAITAHLARGAALADAVRAAHAYLQGAIRAAAAGPALGRGKGPVHHLHPFYPWPAR